MRIRPTIHPMDMAACMYYAKWGAFMATHTISCDYCKSAWKCKRPSIKEKKHEKNASVGT